MQVLEVNAIWPGHCPGKTGHLGTVEVRRGEDVGTGAELIGQPFEFSCDFCGAQAGVLPAFCTGVKDL